MPGPRRRHRKPAPGIAGSGRFDTGIECQQICLEGDFIDDPDDFANFARRSVDLIHRPDCLGDHLAGARGAILDGGDRIAATPRSIQVLMCR